MSTAPFASTVLISNSISTTTGNMPTTNVAGGSGVLIAPNLVLTADHVGKADGNATLMKSGTFTVVANRTTGMPWDLSQQANFEYQQVVRQTSQVQGQIVTPSGAPFFQSLAQWTPSNVTLPDLALMRLPTDLVTDVQKLAGLAYVGPTGQVSARY